MNGLQPLLAKVSRLTSPHFRSLLATCAMLALSTNNLVWIPLKQENLFWEMHRVLAFGDPEQNGKLADVDTNTDGETLPWQRVRCH